MVFKKHFAATKLFFFYKEGTFDASYIKSFVKMRQVGDFAGDLASRFQPLSTFLLGVKDGGYCLGKRTSGWSN